MKNVYYAVIADIHGQSGLLKLALSFIYSTKIKEIVFLGDYIDRGPDSLGVLDIVMNPPQDVKFNTLKGNHEDMQIEYGNDYFYCKKMKEQCNGNLDRKYLDFMKSLPIYHLVDNNIFAHAYFREEFLYEDDINFHQNEILWNRYLTDQPFYSDKYHFTHGHTPHIDMIEIAENRTNLDAGAMYGNSMVIGIYEKNIRGPVFFVHIFANGNIYYYKNNSDTMNTIKMSVDSLPFM